MLLSGWSAFGNWPALRRASRVNIGKFVRAFCTEHLQNAKLLVHRRPHDENIPLFLIHDKTKRLFYPFGDPFGRRPRPLWIYGHKEKQRCRNNK